MPPRPGAPRIVVLSSISGRARLSVAGLRGNRRVAARVETALVSHGAVLEFRVSTTTGNVLLRFDGRRAELHTLVIFIVRGIVRGATASSPVVPRKVASPVAARKAAGVTPIPTWHAIPAADVIARLTVEPSTGLTTAEAAARLTLEGPNRLPVPRPKSALAILSHQVTSLPVLLLGGAAGLSLLTGAVRVQGPPKSEDKFRSPSGFLHW